MLVQFHQIIYYHFYQRFLRSYWSSTRNILTSNETKENFDKESVLERFQIQLKRSGIQKCENTLYPDFNWAVDKDYRIKFQKYIRYKNACKREQTLNNIWG